MASCGLSNRSTLTTLACNRLVSEVKRLKGALRSGGAAPAAAPANPAAGEQLAALLRGMGACVSLVHERRHEQLLKELLDLPLWQVPQVLPSLLMEGSMWRRVVGHAAVCHAR